MKEKIVIKNFSVLENIELEINKINIIIGEQASGKSVLAKLVYFFKSTLIHSFAEQVRLSLEKRFFINSLEVNFKSIFPEYFWKSQNFEITYFYAREDISLRITNKIYSDGSEFITIKLSEKLSDTYEEYQLYARSKREKKETADIRIDIKRIFGYEQVFFTPASRAFFSQVKTNIFSLIMLGHSFDYFTSHFGSFLEQFRKIDSNETKLSAEIENILKGEYRYIEDEEWIFQTNGRKTKLRDSSTGQQELVPMILLFKFIVSLPENNNNLFSIIEEPESHLFPSTQKKLIDMFATVFNLKKNNVNFFLTTHSPYILTCFNNLIQARNAEIALEEKLKSGAISKDALEEYSKKLDKTVSLDKRIDFEDVSVFLIEDGKLVKDLKNYENKLIDADILDNVSEEISAEFGTLLDIEYAE